MKRILLLLLICLFCLNEVQAYDVESSFYYDDEKVVGMWITKEKGTVLMSGLPFFLKRQEDNHFVYCLEPFVMIKQEVGYEGYYELNSLFSVSPEALERIRLVSYFGFGYPGHEADKWYGITQFLIWKAIDPEANIYFSDERYGPEVNNYREEIEEIEFLITQYQALLKYNNQKYVFNDYESFEKFKEENIFLEDVKIGQNVIEIPLNGNSYKKEIFFYHESGQDLYMPSISLERKITFEVNLKRNITLKKWYGSGKYKVEVGAVFDIYKDDQFYQNVKTNNLGEIYLELEFGDYKLVQKQGKEGYSFIDDYLFTVDENTTNTINLYNEAEIIEVPDTMKNSFFIQIYINIVRYINDYRSY